MWKARCKHLANFLGIDEQIISVHDLRGCHAYYGYMSCETRFEKPLLVFTMDSGGDGSNGTVSDNEAWAATGDYITLINCNIGRMYRYATLLLGMRPADHEYKLMGLAAYEVIW